MTVDPYVVRDGEGTITVTPEALARIVTRAAEGVEGARVRRPRRTLEVGVAGPRARVSLELSVRYGAVLPELAGAVQTRVAEALATMCGLEVETVDVSVVEVHG